MKKIRSFLLVIGGIILGLVLISGGAILIPLLLIFFPASSLTPSITPQQQDGYFDVVYDTKTNIYTMCSDPELQKTMCQQALDDCAKIKECYQMVYEYHTQNNETGELTYQDYYNASLVYINQLRANANAPLISP